MRIELSDFPRIQIENGGKGSGGKAPDTFFDSLKQAIDATNAQAKEANEAAVALARGENGNIHETMIAMQKSSISVQLMVAVTNKLIEGYNQLTQLR